MSQYLKLFERPDLRFVLDGSRPVQSLLLLEFMHKRGFNTVIIDKDGEDFVIRFPHASMCDYRLCIQFIYDNEPLYCP